MKNEMVKRSVKGVYACHGDLDPYAFGLLLDIARYQDL
jgi:hypothetical protein